MRRAIGFALIALIGFYIVWPLYTGYRIAKAIEAENAPALDGPVDFAAVRESLRPTLTEVIAGRIDAELKNLGPLGQMLGGDAKAKLLPGMVDQILTGAVTAQNVIRVAQEHGDVKAAIEKVVAEAVGQIDVLGLPAGGAAPGQPSPAPAGGGLRGVLGEVLSKAGKDGDLGEIARKAIERQGAQKPSADSAKSAPAAGKRSFGLGNIKSIGFNGPFGFDIAIARDAGQHDPDATIGMSFRNFDWRLVRFVPRV